SWLVSAILRELPAYRHGNDLGGFSRILTRAVLLVLLLVGASARALAAAATVSDAIGRNLLLILACTTGLIVQNVAVTLFAADHRAAAYAIGNAVARLSGIGLGTYFVFEGHKVHGYLLGLAIGWLSVGALALAVAWPRGGG